MNLTAKTGVEVASGAAFLMLQVVSWEGSLS